MCKTLLTFVKTNQVSFGPKRFFRFASSATELIKFAVPTMKIDFKFLSENRFSWLPILELARSMVWITGTLENRLLYSDFNTGAKLFTVEGTLYCDKGTSESRWDHFRQTLPHIDIEKLLTFYSQSRDSDLYPKNSVHSLQCDQIWRFIGLWTSF